MPQEHGNHIGVCYLELENGLKFVSDTPFECNVSQYTSEALFEAQHINELKSDGTTHVRIDYKKQRLGFTFLRSGAYGKVQSFRKKY